ncbi:hypothetical protein KC363_g132 [Hortaea werneckii]|nr:hypothetical protein KC363_g132 [Hortaea werneckii]
MNFGLASDIPPLQPSLLRCQINFQLRQSKRSFSCSQANLAFPRLSAGALALGILYGQHEFKSSFLRARRRTTWQSGLTFLTRKTIDLRISAHHAYTERTAFPTSQYLAHGQLRYPPGMHCTGKAAERQDGHCSLDVLFFGPQVLVPMPSRNEIRFGEILICETKSVSQLGRQRRPPCNAVSSASTHCTPHDAFFSARSLLMASVLVMAVASSAHPLRKPVTATCRHLERDPNSVSPVRIIFAVVVQPIHLVSDAHHDVVTVSATSCGLAYRNSSKDMLGVLFGRVPRALRDLSTRRHATPTSAPCLRSAHHKIVLEPASLRKPLRMGRPPRN